MHVIIQSILYTFDICDGTQTLSFIDHFASVYEIEFQGYFLRFLLAFGQIYLPDIAPVFFV